MTDSLSGSTVSFRASDTACRVSSVSRVRQPGQGPTWSAASRGANNQALWRCRSPCRSPAAPTQPQAAAWAAIYNLIDNRVRESRIEIEAPRPNRPVMARSRDGISLFYDPYRTPRPYSLLGHPTGRLAACSSTTQSRWTYSACRLRSVAKSSASITMGASLKPFGLPSVPIQPHAGWFVFNQIDVQAPPPRLTTSSHG